MGNATKKKPRGEIDETQVQCRGKLTKPKHPDKKKEIKNKQQTILRGPKPRNHQHPQKQDATAEKECGKTEKGHNTRRRVATRGHLRTAQTHKAQALAVQKENGITH